jgi:hypothetical protein
MPVFSDADNYEEGIAITRTSATNVRIRGFQDWVTDGIATLANLEIQAATTYFDTAGDLFIDYLQIGGTGGRNIISTNDMYFYTGASKYFYFHPNNQSTHKLKIDHWVAGTGITLVGMNGAGQGGLAFGSTNSYVDPSDNWVLGGKASVKGKTINFGNGATNQDWRLRASTTYLYVEYYNGSSWEEISKFERV